MQNVKKILCQEDKPWDEYMNHRKSFCEGMRDGLPIALGYFAVAFTLGIAARNAGLNAFQGFLASLLNNASAGEYAGFTVISSGAAYLEIALVTFITNARYLLMSCSLSQKFAPGMPFKHRFFIGFDVTDELFGICISKHGYLDPYYFYGAILLAIPGWSVGTFIGVIAGNILPVRLVSALSVALYGMFLAVIIPTARKNHIVSVLVIISFIVSFFTVKIPVINKISSGTRIILLTVVISGIAALLFPVSDLKEEENE